MKKGFAGAAWATLILGCYFNLQPSYGAQPDAAPTLAPPLDCTHLPSITGDVSIHATVHDTGSSPGVTEIAINSALYRTSTGDICLRSDVDAHVTITFTLGNDLPNRSWKTSIDSNGRTTANDSIWMKDYSSNVAPPSPGPTDWTKCVSKLVNFAGRDISFDFSGCASYDVFHEYALVTQQCHTKKLHGKRQRVCKGDLKLDPRIVNQPDGLKN